MNKLNKTSIGLLLLAVALSISIYYGNSVFIYFENDNPSTSIGTPEHGSLVNGKRLPTSGPNFTVYSYTGTMLGRNTVNSKVRDAVTQAYDSVFASHPEKRFVYGETGWPGGGRMRPHKTHENGLSVDFMVPVVDEKGRSVPLPASVFNKFGYDIEFDRHGVYGRYRIDFDAMAEHIYELNLAAGRNGLAIRRVIFAPELQPYLINTKFGNMIESTVIFSKKPSWVRHDEHYHVDFDVK